MSGKSPENQSALVRDFKNCSISSRFGLCKLSSGGVAVEVIQEFVAMLEGAVADSSENPDFTSEGLDSVCETGVQWRRIGFENVFPFYMESLLVLPDVEPCHGGPLAVRQGFPGQWMVAKRVFESESPDYFVKNADAWIGWVQSKLADRKFSGGLSFNVLEVTADDLKSGEIDVRPLTLHALSPDGRGVDRGDLEAQAAIVNAFWQTFWATGATRTERGSVFPVAFFPVDRNSSFEFREPFHERYVSLRRRLFGRSAIIGYVLEVLTANHALVFDTHDCRFKIDSAFDPRKHELSSADVVLAVFELNRTGFVDAFTGSNTEAFQCWQQSESGIDRGEPWPYDDDNWKKIRAAGHGIEDSLAAVRANTGSTACIAINRVVPYAGCAYLYQVMLEMDRLKERGKVQGLDGELIGATNSTFFLNFPEEYSTLHSAMNEPVSLLVENGVTRQIKTLKRAAFVLAENGEALITTRAGNRLNSDVLVFEGESSSVTYFEKADRPFRDNKFGPLFFGAVVVGNSIVETFEEIATEIPPAGWLVGDSEAFGGRIDPVNAAEVQVRKPGSLDDVPVRHAFAIGPLLMESGNIIPLGRSREEFVSIKLNQALSFEETSVLPRTRLPEALLDCDARGVPPTRFPYDWSETRAPRSAIGVKEDGSVVVAVVDGRADLPHSVGATLAELAEIMKFLGCRDAMNMDGGGSSVMFVNGPEAVEAKLRSDLRDGIVSLPSDMGGVERLLPVPLVICRRS